jgi:hypothetical protein
VRPAAAASRLVDAFEATTAATGHVTESDQERAVLVSVEITGDRRRMSGVAAGAGCCLIA